MLKSPEEKISLKNLTDAFLAKSNFEIEFNTILEGKSGQEYEVDYYIRAQDSNDVPSRMYVKIFDFKKPAGVDVINKCEKASKDCEAMGLLVSNKFSSQAISLASKTDYLLLLSRNELETIINKPND